MSAIGSVIVMAAFAAFSPGFPSALGGRRTYGVLGSRRRTGELPAALGDAGELARVGHLPEAHPAQAELAVDRVRPAAPLAPGVPAHLELRLARGLVDESCLGHDQASLIAIAIMLLGRGIRAGAAVR